MVEYYVVCPRSSNKIKILPKYEWEWLMSICADPIKQFLPSTLYEEALDIKPKPYLDYLKSDIKLLTNTQ